MANYAFEDRINVSSIGCFKLPGDIYHAAARQNRSQVFTWTMLIPIQFKYRLTKCGELSLGIFCTATPESNLPAETLATGKPVETCRKNKARSVLLAHVVATKTKDGSATDESMNFPRDWETKKSEDNTQIGHREEGRTICVHSLAVLPAFQKSGIGRTLMMAYMQQMNGAGIADRLALVAHDVSRSNFTFLSPLKLSVLGAVL